MPRNIVDYRVFIASPGGLDAERREFRRILQKINDQDANDRGVQFTPVGWEHTLSGHGRPQALINEDIRSCDYFVLVLHTKWGTPPGDPGDKYSSGTEEEFECAKKFLADRDLHMRQIVVLFKEVSVDILVDPGEGVRKVLNFK